MWEQLLPKLVGKKAHHTEDSYDHGIVEIIDTRITPNAGHPIIELRNKNEAGDKWWAGSNSKYIGIQGQDGHLAITTTGPYMSLSWQFLED